MPAIEPGQKAPVFSLKDQDGRADGLKEFAGRPLILCFYPKDDTPGCTKGACAFRDRLPDFARSQATVLGVSVLDVAGKARFARKHELNFPLLADPDHEVALRYGAWKRKSMYRGPRQGRGIEAVRSL